MKISFPKKNYKRKRMWEFIEFFSTGRNVVYLSYDTYVDWLVVLYFLSFIIFMDYLISSELVGDLQL